MNAKISLQRTSVLLIQGKDKGFKINHLRQDRGSISSIALLFFKMATLEDPAPQSDGLKHRLDAAYINGLGSFIQRAFDLYSFCS